MNGKRRRPLLQEDLILVTPCYQKKQMEQSQSIFLSSEQQQTLEDELTIEDECSDLCQKMQSRNDVSITTASKQINFETNRISKSQSLKFPKIFKNTIYIKETYTSQTKQLQIIQDKSTMPNTQNQINMQNIIEEKQSDQKLVYNMLKKDNQKKEKQKSNLEHLFQTSFDKIEPVLLQTTVKIQRNNFIAYKRHKIQDQYLILQKLGEGAFGNVYKCQHKLSKSIRSVKIIKQKIQDFKRNLTMLRREIQVLKKLDHPSILKVIQIFQHQKVTYIVCEFCEGGTLQSYLSKRFIFSKEMKKIIMKKILQAVNYIHKMGIIHRDLKPENILFVNKITLDSTLDSIDIRIIDFGLSIQFTQCPFKDWAKIGSLPFMAPQVFKGIYSTKSDIWSCGVIMHLLYLSFNPFFDSEDVYILKKIEYYNLQKNQKFQELQYEEKAILSSLLNKNYVLRADSKIIMKQQYFQICRSKLYASKHRRTISESLKNYKKQKSIMNFIKYYLMFNKLTQQSQKRTGQCFSAIDTNKNGVISEDELKQLFANQNQIDDRTFKIIFQSINLNGNQNISFGQFLCALTSKQQLFTIQNINQIFKKMDISKDGLVDLYELKYFLVQFDKKGKRVQNIFEDILDKKTAKMNSNQFAWYILDQVYFQQQTSE